MVDPREVIAEMLEVLERDYSYLTWPEKAERILAALSEAGVEMSQWQPIETAPKDGTWILTFVNGLAEIPAVTSWQTFPKPLFSGKQSRWCPFETADFSSDDEWEWRWTETDYFPTHWMPLPAPPTSRQAQLVPEALTRSGAGTDQEQT